jgi:4-hydroxy-2-oxoheptanedioate aldolase
MIRELEKVRALKARLRAGEACLGAQIALSDPIVAEIFGRAGFDWIVVDAEHAPNSAATIRAMLQAAMGSPAVLMARPLKFDADQIRHYLDLGSPGVLCPFINNGKEASDLVRACRYPPAGIRGYGPRRAGVFGFDADEYFASANEAILAIPMIESREAVDNIDEIVSVDGIDTVCIGPYDLSISLGIVGQFDNPRYLDAAEVVRQACKRHGKAMGTACASLEYARQCASKGDALLLIAGDDHYISSEARRAISTMRPSQGGATPSTPGSS